MKKKTIKEKELTQKQNLINEIREMCQIKEDVMIMKDMCISEIRINEILKGQLENKQKIEDDYIEAFKHIRKMDLLRAEKYIKKNRNSRKYNKSCSTVNYGFY